MEIRYKNYVIYREGEKLFKTEYMDTDWSSRLRLMGVSLIVSLVISFMIQYNNGYGLITTILSVVFLLMIFSILTWRLTKNHGVETSAVNNRMGFERFSIDHLNEIVLVGEDPRDENSTGVVRRLYAILEIDEKGYVRLKERCRRIGEIESYKKDLCNDAEIGRKEWDKIVTTYLDINFNRNLKKKIEESQNKIERQRKLVRDEYNKKDDYIRRYKENNGSKSLPTALEKEKETLKNDLKQLDNKMEKLGKDYVKLSKREKVNI